MRFSEEQKQAYRAMSVGEVAKLSPREQERHVRAVKTEQQHFDEGNVFNIELMVRSAAVRFCKVPMPPKTGSVIGTKFDYVDHVEFGNKPFVLTSDPDVRRKTRVICIPRVWAVTQVKKWVAMYMVESPEEKADE